MNRGGEDGRNERGKGHCPAERVGELVEVILVCAQTGHRGDGVIIVSEVTDVVSVRTGDHDRVAWL
ncbi:MAG: P-II family nitrogen regulator [Longimicrobiales bacterium]|nr:P-II family nitrogen regulator [Longimicrobiales bacterium]